MNKYIIKAKNAGAYLIEACKYFMLYPWAIFKYRNHDIFLFSERGFDARDNGYHLFKYVRTMYPQVEAYYIADRNSPDFEKVSKLGNVVQHRSLKHYLLFIASNYKISTHIAGYSPNMMFYFKYFNFPLRGRRIFLQHGITKADLTTLYADRTGLDLFICGAKPEFEYVCSHFGYRPGIVQYTGLARYDALMDSMDAPVRSNQILIMPTWRMYISTLADEELKETEYVKRWNSLLNSAALIEFCNKTNSTVIFYPHFEMQKHIGLFSASSDKIIIADKHHYDVQQLLKTSALMITDYSSVYFDFAYMNKPCFYYQFDREEFYSKHYKTGYFDERRNGFGEVCETEDEVLSILKEYETSDYCVKEEYQKRIDDFFTMRDQDNCKRIWGAIQKL